MADRMKREIHIDQIMTAPVDVFCQMSGLGSRKVWELIGDGTLASVLVGRRRLVVIESWRRYIADHSAAVRPGSGFEV
jgi:hypothetical protein